ncbi:zinc finger, CCHC-type containing protein [Tanacetum coccineum]
MEVTSFLVVIFAVTSLANVRFLMTLKIDNVEHVDNLGFNLLSIGQICDNKCRVTFFEHDSEITKDGKVIGRGIRKKGLYVMKLGNKPKDKICLATIDENSTLWHRRLGHANMRLIQSLASKELVRNLPKLKFDQHFCDACKIGKQAHVSHKAKNIVSTTRCLELLHMDLFGPSAVRSYRGNRYTLVIVDDYSRFQAHLETFEGELTLVELGSHLRIEESLRMQDNDKPKGNNVVGPSVVNMVEHNNSSRYNDNKGKRKHHDNTKADPNKKSKVTCWKCGKPRHLKKDCRGGKVGNKANGSGTIVQGDDDVAWWVDSGATVHVCKDRCWFKTYESLNDGSILHMGNESTALVHGRGCVDLKFSSGKIVSLLNIDNDNIASAFMSTYKLNDSILWHARLGHVRFKRMQDMSKDWLIPAFDIDTEKAVVRLPDPKLKTLGERGIECIFIGYVEHSKAFRFYVIEPNDSVSINSIIESNDAIFDENRFSPVSRPSLRIPNGTKDISGSVVPKEVTEEDDPKTFDEAMKSQDVAFWKEAINDEMDSIIGNNTWVLADLPPGFKQKSRIDYFDTYAPVARISTIRLLIAMATIHNLIIHQMDVKTAFLNGDLEEKVYMNQPRGFIMSDDENKVCKLIKSLYGLKQAPKQWHQKFDEVVLSNSDLLNQADKYLYSKFDESGKGVIICLYVDDMLIFSTDQVQVDLTKEFLSSKFSMKDMGEADVILGIRIKHESNEIAISQSHYIQKVLKKFNYFDCTPVSALMDTERSDANKIDITGYPLGLKGYTDASWISNTEDNSSTSGWVFLLGGGAISWASKKQTCITGSTMKSEFVALAAAGKEAEWLKKLLLEIPSFVKPITPISIRCDSAAILTKAYSQMYNGK